jgi:hypothetical protein
MVSMYRFTFLVFLSSAGLLTAFAQDLRYQPDPHASEHMMLLLKDYDPKSMLHAAVHETPRAKFPVIDIHNHVNDPYGDHAEEIPPAEVVRRMDSSNVQKIVILTGMWGDKPQGLIDKMVKPYRNRFIVFTQIDWSKIDDPNFSEEMVVQLDDAVRRGARGLKVLKDLGLGVKDKSGQFIPVDDARLDPIWEECGRLGIPVAIHISDPEAFFTPLDRHNERYEELNENPTWSFFGPQFPSKEKLLAERNHVVEKHPRTTFIALHVANWPENLDAVRLARQIPEPVRRIRRSGGGVGQTASPGQEVLSRLFRPDFVWDRRSASRIDVRELFSLVGNRR